MADTRDASDSQYKESKVSAAAAKPSVDNPDKSGIKLAIQELTRLIRTGQKFWRKAGSPKARQEPALPEVEQPPVNESVAASVEAGSAYNLLGVGRLSSFDEIHICFLRLIRDLLQTSFATGQGNRASREQLRKLCIAHDVLHDPVTRTDYDFRVMGVRGTEDQAGQATNTNGLNRPPLRIGELLQCAEILDLTELEIAVDMHKATPEMMFGQFLVKSGFLTLEELDSALLGQRLILAGRLTVAQFQIAMAATHNEGIPLAETLQKNGWMDEAELEPFLQPPESLPQAAITPVVYVEPEVVAQEQDQHVEHQLSIQNAVPTWANQLIWDDEPQAQPKLSDSESDTKH